ncbi:DUF6491 family protein [Pseudofulvimonas gallinarii]|jgi:hypothetical protein|uniref:Lipoprotein n=1 Tax=Pseudofulvimonas gallinarii TaxID=634155 RepID=A0A4R3LHY3_9GAMM|nr:DUF6491 family protein [Pseudofulvimonas gallinarii]TCS99280.1 hypothetical protein EDC25_106119 [Pseudofulvimonas gallinarii]THD13920.1 hypothetical protein B1808_05375 [Pseudofulvimonas gallinarii]
MNVVRITCLATVLALAACASTAERRQFEQEQLAIYSKHAGEPVDRIRSFRLISWQPAGDLNLLLEARLNEWYWLEVDGPCMELPYAQAIGVKTSMNTLQARFDSILVEGQPCRIRTIRPIDYKAARAELRELRESRQ